jgi:hypothetical protein
MNSKKFRFLTLLFCLGKTLLFAQEKDRIPFYEDYFENADLAGYLTEAQQFLSEQPNSPEAARVALDYLMMSKAAENIDSVKEATNLLMFDYLGSLPSLFFLSSFDAGSPRLNQLLLAKTEENDPHDANFSKQFCETLSLLGRLHGPKLLYDPSLRIRAYLISQNANKSEVLKNLTSAVIELKENPSYTKLIDIITSDSSPVEQVVELSKISHPDSDYCLTFYSALLEEGQLNSSQIVELQVNRTLFSPDPNPHRAQDLISRLPNEIAKSTKYQVFIAFAQAILENRDSTLDTLKYAQTNPNGEDAQAWAATAKSFADGIEFEESRKKLLLSQFEKVFTEIIKPRDALYVKFAWKSDEQDEKRHLNGQIAISVKSKYFEFHANRGGSPFFAYRTDANSSALFLEGMEGEASFQFAEPGVYPVPTIDIQRDRERGSFNYSFNLNFSKDMDDLLSQSLKTVDNSYLSTGTGREVLLNHLMTKKGLWLTPPAATETGTKFQMNSLQNDTPTPKPSSLHIELSGDLTELQIGSLHIEKINRGTDDVLQDMAPWPSAKITDKEHFDFQLLMQAVGQITKP